jgi:deoxyribonuclease-4
MADHPRFGPAGVPPPFRLVISSIAGVPRLLREEGLDAFEYEAIYWGAKPQIKQEEAEKLGSEARANDVWLSLHGSYFVNLVGEKQVVEASKRRLIASATAAEWMKAHVVVFHPGFYGRRSPKEAFKSCVESMKEIVEEMKALGIDDVRLGAETMGKSSQLGSLEEVMGFCEEVEQAQLVIDWSHLHARNHGRFRKIDDFRRVVEEVENRLGKEVAENMHCHFTKIEYSSRGERRHHVLDESGYGPSFEMLAKVIAEFKLKPVFICESPLLDIDAAKMRDMLKRELKGASA